MIALIKKKIPDDLAAVVYTLCYYIKTRSILQKRQDQERTQEGMMKSKMVRDVAYAKSHGWRPLARRISQ